MTVKEKPKHTPGPWAVDEDYGGEGLHGINSTTEPWKAIADCRANHEGRGVVSKEEAEANARLIAAAPDLLAAVESLYTPEMRALYDGAELTDVLTVEMVCRRDELFALFAAIRKAKGES